MLRRKISLYTLMAFLMPFIQQVYGQQKLLNYENNYRLPLNEVLKELETRFSIKIKSSADLVEDRKIDFAPWKFRATLEATEINLLFPEGLKLEYEGEGIYKLKDYEYHRWKHQEGWDFLALLSGKYQNREEWELRKDSLRKELIILLQLEKLRRIAVQPVRLGKMRVYSDYTVENFALEIIPGVYVNGSIYKPRGLKDKLPVMLSPDGHWAEHRYREDAQKRFITLARLGTMAISYDLFAWGESRLQFKSEDHRTSVAMLMQTWAGIRVLDYIYEQPDVDKNRIGISGGSGGGSHTILLSALDARFTLTAPVVSMSSYFFGGCPCESGLPVHFVGSGTNNVELAAMTAPNPQLIVSDGRDWTSDTDKHDYPYLQRVYSFYDESEKVQHVHFEDEGHDFGWNKRQALYRFVIENFHLENQKNLEDKIKENHISIEPKENLLMFGTDGKELPPHAVMGMDDLKRKLQECTIRYE